MWRTLMIFRRNFLPPPSELATGNVSWVRSIYSRMSHATFLRFTSVISKVLHAVLARPVGWCNPSDFGDSCEPHFSKEQCVRIGRLRGPCSAKRSLEMEEETDWSQISRSVHRPYFNARPHASGAVSEILEKYGWQVLPHPLYSPDMNPSAFDLFPALKKPLRGKRFRSIEEVSNEVTRVIWRINNEGILTGIQDLPKRWSAVIKHNGDYMESL